MSKKRHRDIPIEVEEKPTKQEYAIAKYLKNNTPTKKTKFLSHQVNYFYANKLIDAALDSPWATGKDVVFTDRQSVVDYCDRFLKFKFFHRAKKIAITDKDLKPKDLKKKKIKEIQEKKLKEKEEKKKEKEKEKEKEKKAIESKKEEEEKEDQKEKEEKESKEDENIDDDEEDGDKNEEDTDKNQETEEKEVAKKEKKKKKTKIKLDMHLEQIFVDGTDAYVWMYDPIPFWYYIVGGLCLFGAIAVCLFPLWPPEVRKGVYYLSVAAAGFLGVILGLAVVRFVVFCIIWTLTMGRHHLWLLPNLTEDVGFFQSFWPLYHYEYRGDDYKGKKKRKKKSIEEIAEEEEEEEKEDEDKKSEGEDQGAIDSPDTAAETDKPETDGERGGTEATGISESESENSNSQAFEIVDKEDLVEAQEAEKDKDKEEQSDTDNDETTDSQENKKEEKVEE